MVIAVRRGRPSVDSGLGVPRNCVVKERVWSWLPSNPVFYHTLRRSPVCIETESKHVTIILNRFHTDGHEGGLRWMGLVPFTPHRLLRVHTKNLSNELNGNTFLSLHFAHIFFSK